MTPNATKFMFIRHGPTPWNAAGRIQGHTDVPLSEEGRLRVMKQKIPPDYAGARWVSSPLLRAVQTANLMGCSEPETEPLLMEMHWGRWEGLTLDQLRNQLGDEMRDNENRGLDFNPVGGESPRQVRQRVQKWLCKTAVTPVPHVAVTHKGVIRATLSLATGWDMIGPPPVRLDWSCGHEFLVDGDGGITLCQANVCLLVG